MVITKVISIRSACKHRVTFTDCSTNIHEYETFGQSREIFRGKGVLTKDRISS